MRAAQRLGVVSEAAPQVARAAPEGAAAGKDPVAFPALRAWVAPLRWEVTGSEARVVPLRWEVTGSEAWVAQGLGAALRANPSMLRPPMPLTARGKRARWPSTVARSPAPRHWRHPIRKTSFAASKRAARCNVGVRTAPLPWTPRQSPQLHHALCSSLSRTTQAQFHPSAASTIEALRPVGPKFRRSPDPK